MLEGDLSAVTVAALLLVRVPPSHAATCLFAPGAVCVATQFARPPPVATLPGGAGETDIPAGPRLICWPHCSQPPLIIQVRQTQPQSYSSSPWQPRHEGI